MKTFSKHLNLFFVSIIIAFLFSGCLGIISKQGNGKIIKQDRVIKEFNAIEISGSYDVVMKNDSIPSVTVEADENLQSLITTKVHNKTLIIENKESIRGSKTLKIYISGYNPESISISGAVDIACSDTITAKKMNIDVSGVGGVMLKLDVQKLEIDCSGSGNITLAGRAGDVDASISGTGKLNAFELLTGTFKLNTSGVGKADLNVLSSLDVSISGSATVNYKGNPRIDQDISGVGTLKRVN